MEFIHNNPAEVVELGTRVVFEIVNEQDSSEATRHYENCPKKDDPEACGFCYYGLYSDFKEHLQDMARNQKYGTHLGDIWYF